MNNKWLSKKTSKNSSYLELKNDKINMVISVAENSNLSAKDVQKSLKKLLNNINESFKLQQGQQKEYISNLMDDMRSNESFYENLQNLLDDPNNNSQPNNTQSNNTQPNNTQSNNTQSNNTQSNKTQPNKTQPNKTQPNNSWFKLI